VNCLPSFHQERFEHQLNIQCLGFLNDLVALLWPNINVAGSKMTKDIAGPMFKTMLPGPLASLHFTKVDLGNIPIVFSNVLVTKIGTDGIKLDLNVDWDGKSDIELKGEMIPSLVSQISCLAKRHHLNVRNSCVQQGVKGVELHGRLSILLCPLTNVIPLVCNSHFALS
jgi:hypothetical protein